MKNAINLKKVEIVNIVKERYGRKRFVRYAINRAIDTITRWCNKEEEQKAQEESREPIIIPHFSCHVFRHTFCTRFCENETNIKVIQEIMGHTNFIKTVLNSTE